MSKTPCKATKKDGSPCNGNGLKQFDGLCIAHGPTGTVDKWRSLGGKNSATAARLDKRIPERYKELLNTLDDSTEKLKDGTLSPARYDALCRGVKLKLDVYRQADAEMDLIRAEEKHAAAAKFAGAHGDLDILDTAAAITAKQDRYRSESLVAQGFADFEEPSNPDEPPDVVLTDRGRRRFGYHNLDLNQELLNEVEDQLTEYNPEKSDLPNLPETNDLLDTIVQTIKKTQSGLAHDPGAPFDPLTGKPLTKLPSSVRVKAKLSAYTRCDEPPQEVLEDQLRQAKELKRAAKELSEDEDYKRRAAEQEDNKQKWQDVEVFLDAQKANGHVSNPTPQAPSWQ